MINLYNHSEYIYVYGSSLCIKNRGDAFVAKRHFQANGLIHNSIDGMSYPLLMRNENDEILSLHLVEENIRIFLEFAKANPDLKFMLTSLGCGEKGHDDLEILSLFERLGIPDNVLMTGYWSSLREADYAPRVIIAGGRDFDNFEYLRFKCEKLLERQKFKDVHIISGNARGVDRMGEMFFHHMKKNGCDKWELDTCPADWNKFGKQAGYIRNSFMSHLATHLIAFWDGKSRGTKNMIDIAIKKGIDHRVIQY